MADARSPGEPGALLVTQWYGGAGNGVALVVESLAQSLHAAGRPVAVLQLRGDGWRAERRLGSAGEEILSVCIRDPGAASSIWRRVAANLRALIAARAIRRLVRDRGLGVAHFHYAFAEYDVVRRITNGLRLPIVATFHGNDLGVNMDDAPTRAATERLLRDSAAATTVSNALGERLRQLFPFVASRARTVHNAVPAAFLTAAESLPATPRDVDVLFVGNLIPRKGVDVLLRALALVRERVPDLRARIVGDGTERRALEVLAVQLGLKGVVEFTGQQPRDEIVRLFGRARVAAVPSRAEPFGLVVVEALVCGAAVVASDVGGIPEIAAETGGVTLVPPDDSAALAGAIAALLADDDQRQQTTSSARRRASEVFAPAAIRDAYLAAYRAALAMD